MTVRYDPVHSRTEEREGHVYCANCQKHLSKFCCRAKR